METQTAVRPWTIGPDGKAMNLPAPSFLIHGTDGTITQREPTDGKWYCAMFADESYAEHGVNNGFRDETLGQYSAQDFAFYDEDHEVRMGACDHLVEQF